MMTAISFWMYDGFQLNERGVYTTSPDFKKFDPLTGESKNTSTVVRKNASTVFVRLVTNPRCSCPCQKSISNVELYWKQGQESAMIENVFPYKSRCIIKVPDCDATKLHWIDSCDTYQTCKTWDNFVYIHLCSDMNLLPKALKPHPKNICGFSGKTWNQTIPKANSWLFWARASFFILNSRLKAHETLCVWSDDNACYSRWSGVLLRHTAQVRGDRDQHDD